MKAPTLLIVGENDFGVIELNEAVYDRLRCEKRLVLIPGATHLFEEPGTPQKAALIAKEWFVEHIQRDAK
ncbi:MAG: hypothetical protein L3J42_06460 [Hydrogenimonas sp.]|nr:hypothetical protein [Hydrogenimonas sp.]